MSFHDYESMEATVKPQPQTESTPHRFDIDVPKNTVTGKSCEPVKPVQSAAASAQTGNNFVSFEDLVYLDPSNRRAEVLEAFEGTKIVRWHNKITGQLVNLLADAEKNRNYPYCDKLRKFLEIWRGNEITGSINRETIETLKAASDILAVDQWTLNKYFLSLAGELKVLIASEEMLPRGLEEPGNEPMVGMGGGGRGAPPMSPDYGPEKEGPGGEEPPAGGPGGGPAGGPAGGPGMPPEVPPGEGEAPGAEPGAPAPEENTEEEPEPEEMPGERLGLA